MTKVNVSISKTIQLFDDDVNAIIIEHLVRVYGKEWSEAHLSWDLSEEENYEDAVLHGCHASIRQQTTEEPPAFDAATHAAADDYPLSTSIPDMSISIPDHGPSHQLSTSIPALFLCDHVSYHKAGLDGKTFCDMCGSEMLPSGVDGGSWVHKEKREKIGSEYWDGSKRWKVNYIWDEMAQAYERRDYVVGNPAPRHPRSALLDAN